MAEREALKPFKSNMSHYVKCAVVENGEIKRMYWEYPGDPEKNDDFAVEPVIERWRELYPHIQDTREFARQEFLSQHGFAAHNVTRDGVRPMRG